MVDMEWSKNDPRFKGGSSKSDIGTFLDQRFAEIHASSRVTCAVIQSTGDQLLVNSKLFAENQRHNLDLPLLKSQGEFQARCAGNEILIIFDSARTGTIEERMPKGELRIAVFLGDRFYLAPDAITVSFKADGTLWLGGNQLLPERPVLLGVGELAVENHDGAWIGIWRHPDDTPQDTNHPKCRAVLTRPGSYELTYVFGALMTISHAVVELSTSGFSVNNQPVLLRERIPFHVEGDGRLWLEAEGSEIYVRYQDSMRSDRKRLGQKEAPARFDLSYNSGPGLGIKPLA